MSEIQIFNNPEFGEIRTIMIDNEPWFVAKDISEKLGYARTPNMIKLVDDEDKRNICSSDLEHQVYKQNYTIGIINESGLYAAIFGSKQENAKKFKKWVTSEVLPSIRKTGHYGQKQLPSDPMELLELHYQALKQVDNKVNALSDGLSTVRRDLEDFKNDLPILGIEESRITNAVKKKGVECLGGKESPAYNDKSLRSRLYADLHRQLRREFDVSSYKAIKRNQVYTAINIVRVYAPPLHLSETIKTVNAQQSFEGLEGRS